MSNNWENDFLKEEPFPVQSFLPKKPKTKKSKVSIPDHVKRQMEEHEVRLAHMRRRIRDQYSKTERRKNQWDPELYPTFVFRRPGDVHRPVKTKPKITQQPEWDGTTSESGKSGVIEEEFYNDFKVRLVDYIAQNEIFDASRLEDTLKDAANEVVTVRHGVDRRKIVGIIKEIRSALDLK